VLEVSKTQGKFHKNPDYFDDFETVNNKFKQRYEHKESKKVTFREIQEGYKLNDLDAEEYDTDY
jgi:hypothetical protein